MGVIESEEWLGYNAFVIHLKQHVGDRKDTVVLNLLQRIKLFMFIRSSSWSWCVFHVFTVWGEPRSWTISRTTLPPIPTRGCHQVSGRSWGSRTRSYGNCAMLREKTGRSPWTLLVDKFLMRERTLASTTISEYRHPSFFWFCDHDLFILFICFSGQIQLLRKTGRLSSDKV